VVVDGVVAVAVLEHGDEGAAGLEGFVQRPDHADEDVVRQVVEQANGVDHIEPAELADVPFRVDHPQGVIAPEFHVVLQAACAQAVRGVLQGVGVEVDAGQLCAGVADDGGEFGQFAAGSTPDIEDAGSLALPHFFGQDVPHQGAAVADAVGEGCGQEVPVEQLADARRERLVVVSLLDDLIVARVALGPGARALHEEALRKMRCRPLPELALLLPDGVPVGTQLLLQLAAERLDAPQLIVQLHRQVIQVRVGRAALRLDRFHRCVELGHCDVQLFCSPRPRCRVGGRAVQMHPGDLVVSVTVDALHFLPRVMSEVNWTTRSARRLPAQRAGLTLCLELARSALGSMYQRNTECKEARNAGARAERCSAARQALRRNGSADRAARGAAAPTGVQRAFYTLPTDLSRWKILHGRQS